MAEKEAESSPAIALRDTTLREGIQVPGSLPSLEDKLELVGMLDEIGVPEIEVGLPGGTPACAALAASIHERGLSIKSTALVPCYIGNWREHVDLAADSGVHRIDILAPVSDYLLAEKDHYRLTPDQLAGKIREVAEYANAGPLELGAGLIDSARAPRDRVLDLAVVAAEAGITRLIVYDSVGTMVPSRMKEFVQQVREASGIDVLVHCHNDFGMATANSLAAVEGGATAVDVAVNGLGGRAGNASLEEIAMALEHLYGLRTAIDVTGLRRVSDFAAKITSTEVSPLKPIVGDFCFAHLPVMHIRCIAAGNGPSFEPFPPESVGIERTFHFDLPVNYREAAKPFLQAADYPIDDETVDRFVHLLQERRGTRGWRREEIVDLIQDDLGRDEGNKP